MRTPCSKYLACVTLGLSVLITPTMAGYGEMDMAFGFNLLPRASSTSGNLQTFTGALGGVTADPITSTGDTARPFSVDGNTFTVFSDALQRSCDNQNTACSDAANAGDNKEFTVGDCTTQETSCLKATQGTGTAASSSTTTASAQQTLFSQDANFLYICDV